MSAPALIALAHGNSDPRVAQVTHAVVEQLSEHRPDLAVRGAFLDGGLPRVEQVITELVALGRREIVLVPLELHHHAEADPQVAALVARCREIHPDVAFVAARPLGPEANLLAILDERLRSALAKARCLELDGLVLSVETQGDVLGSAVIARRARQWSTHHRLPCVVATADTSGASVSQAIASLRAQGRRHIAVGSFFLTADAPYAAQADQAVRAGAIAVSEPLGASHEVVDLVLARYAYASMDLLDFVDGTLTFDDLLAGAESDWSDAV